MTCPKCGTHWTQGHQMGSRDGRIDRRWPWVLECINGHTTQIPGTDDPKPAPG